jgi:hypothetical protein
VRALIGAVPYDPILATQLGLHHLEGDTITHEDITRAETILATVERDFELNIKRERIDLASYADLPNLMIKLGNTLRRADMVAKGRGMVQWFLKNQRSDGAFPLYPHSAYAHTRGHCKILESLIQAGVSCNDLRIVRALEWMHSMQYGETNNYCIPVDIRQKMHGGFRHDAQNTSVRIDATAHYLTALAFSELQGEKGLEKGNT